MKPDVHTELSLLREELVRQEDTREEWLAQLAALQEELPGINRRLDRLFNQWTEVVGEKNANRLLIDVVRKELGLRTDDSDEGQG